MTFSRAQARQQIEKSPPIYDLEFLVMDMEENILAHVYAPFWNRNWALSCVAEYSRLHHPIRVDQLVNGEWRGDIEWKNLGN